MTNIRRTEPAVTVVIPVYNRADVVCRTLDSVAAQTVRPLALVLVDNASTDGSGEVIRRWAAGHSAPDFDIRVLDEPRPGACRARNAGLAAVRTEWTMFFDSDDVMTPDHVERALATAARRPDADIICWDFCLLRADGRRERHPFIMHDVLYNNVMHSSFSTMRYMARTEHFRRVGGWLEDARMFDDCELGVRLLALKPHIVHAGRRFTVYVNESPDSITNTTEGRVGRMRVALDAVAGHLGPRRRHWAELQRLIMTSTWARRDPEAPALARRILAAQPPGRRLLWRLLYNYSLAGGRGVARIYRFLTAFKL